MPPINSSILPTGTGTTLDDKDWVTQAGIARNTFGELHRFFQAAGYTLELPPGVSLAFGPHVYLIVENGADMAEVVGGPLNLPPDTAPQVRYLSLHTRRAGEYKVWLEQELAKANSEYTRLTGILCEVGGFFVSQVKALDATPRLADGVRPAVDQAKGPILKGYDDNNAAIQQNRLHNKQLLVHGQMQAAAVKADLQVTQAENTVLRGSSLNKDVLQAPPAPKKAGRAKAPVHKTGTPSAPRKPGKPRKSGKSKAGAGKKGG